jgi:hypothetical protein
MQNYKITFTGRLCGSIGKLLQFTKTIKAKNFEDANLKLYSNYEHISIINYKTI